MGWVLVAPGCSLDHQEVQWKGWSVKMESPDGMRGDRRVGEMWKTHMGRRCVGLLEETGSRIGSRSLACLVAEMLFALLI